MARGKQLAVLATGLLLALPARGESCTCIAQPPICQSFWAADQVFAGEVLAVDAAEHVLEGRRLSLHRVRVRVERSWRGEDRGDVEVFTQSTGAMCGYNFTIGEKYLIFASSRDAAIHVSLCGATRKYRDAREQLAYIDQSFPPSTGGRVFGQARLDENLRGEVRGLPAVKVTLSGGSVVRATQTGTDGSFEFKDVPAGKYEIGLEVAEPFDAWAEQWVELADPRGCARIEIAVDRPTQLNVRGSVVRPNARSAAGVNVAIYTVENGAAARRITSVTTDREGRFSIRVRSGRRYMVVGTTNDERAEVGPFELTPATAPILIVLRPRK